MSKSDWLKELQNLEMLQPLINNQEVLGYILNYISYIQDRIQSFEGDSNGQILHSFQTVPVPVHRR